MSDDTDDDILTQMDGMDSKQLAAFMERERQAFRNAKDVITSMEVDNPDAQAHYRKLVEKEREEQDSSSDIYSATYDSKDKNASMHWTPKLERSATQTYPVKNTLHILNFQNRRLPVQNYTIVYDMTCKPQGEPVDLSPFEKKTYMTFHSNAFQLFYKPTVAEMLSQLPEETFQKYLDGQTLYLKNRIISDDARIATCRNYDGGFHIAITEVYYDDVDRCAKVE